MEAKPGTQTRPRTVDVFPPTTTEPDDRRVRCYKAWVSPAGGDPIHDEYARYVAERYGNPSYATVSYWLEEDGLAADFDHHNPDIGVNEFFEAKTRHEILLREWAGNQPLVLARLLTQADEQVEILNRYALPGWRLIWRFDDEEVAETAREYLPITVDEVRHVPWRRELPARSRPRRRSRRR